MPTSASPPLPLKQLGLFSLFPPGRIFLDTDGDGCPDRVSLFIGVPPRLDNRGMWAGILNLTARLAAEAVGLVRPIVGPLGKAPSAGPSLLVYKPSPRHPVAAEMTRLAADRVALRGHSPAALAALLHTLAIDGSDPSSLFPGWAVVQSHARRSDRMRMLDRHGRCLAELRLRRPEAAALRPRPGPRQCDLLDVARTFYHSPHDAPMTRSLRLSVELAAESVAPQLGVALSEVVARIVLEATQIALPVATVGAPPAGGITLRVSDPARGPASSCSSKGPRRPRPACCGVGSRSLFPKGPRERRRQGFGQRWPPSERAFPAGAMRSRMPGCGPAARAPEPSCVSAMGGRPKPAG